MKLRPALFALLWVPACARAPEALTRDAAWMASTARLDRASRTSSPAWDADRPVRREALLAAVLDRHPALAADAHRVRAMLHAARAERSLGAPTLEAQVWNLPLARPYALGEADMYMLTLRQMFPAPGSLDARGRAAVAEAHALAADLAAREREVVEQVEGAFADYARGAEGHRVRAEHLGLLAQLREAAQARYAVGGAGLADVVRVDGEVERLRRAMARSQGEVARARAALNALLRRPSDATLGPPELEPPAADRPSTEALLALAARSRAVHRAAAARLESAHARRDATAREAAWPSFEVGAGYFQDPQSRPGLGASVSLTLPWLSGAARARRDEADALEAAARGDADAARWSVQGEVTDAAARLDAIDAERTVLHDRALPTARRALEAVAGAYVVGRAALLDWIDAARTVLDLRVEEAELDADRLRAAASLDRAVGAPVPRAPAGRDASEAP